MHDLTEQKKAEENTNLNQERLEKLLYLTQMKNFSIQNIFDYALEVSISLTKSKVGYIYYYSEEYRQFTLFSWSNEAMKECSIVEKQTIYDLDKTGIWGEAVRQRKPIIVNDFQASNDLKNVNMLNPTQLIGINTVGSSLRNANYDIRSEPANPRVNVGPWNQSTIEPDFMRPPLEIGAGTQ